MALRGHARFLRGVPCGPCALPIGGMTMTDQHVEHLPGMTRAAATERELEEIHDALIEVLQRLDLINQQLSLCVEALEALVVSQG